MSRSSEGMGESYRTPGEMGDTHHERREGIILWSWGNGRDTMLDDTLRRLEAFS